MKKTILIIAALATIQLTLSAQTQRTNRTNSRSHYQDTSKNGTNKMDNRTDADRNNPVNNTNNDKNGVNTSTPTTNPNTNNPNINNNVR